MQIFELRQPEVPVKLGRRCALTSPPVGLPGIHCWGVPGACGNTWGAVNRRVRTELPAGHPLRLVSRWPVAPDEFYRLVQSLVGFVDVPKSELLPGTDIGLMHITCSDPGLFPLEWLSLGSVLISGSVKQLLAAEDFAGWHTADIVFDGMYGSRVTEKYYELIVDRILPVATHHITVKSICKVCGRVERDVTRPLSMESESAVNTSEGFFRIKDIYTPLIFISARVKSVLENSHLADFEIVSFEQALADIRKHES